MPDVTKESTRIRKGGDPKYHERLKQQEKLFVRERLNLLLDPGWILEDGMYANVLDEKLPADGVVTVIGKIHGRTVCVMANDSTIKAGSWGKRTVEKISLINSSYLPLILGTSEISANQVVFNIFIDRLVDDPNQSVTREWIDAARRFRPPTVNRLETLIENTLKNEDFIKDVKGIASLRDLLEKKA